MQHFEIKHVPEDFLVRESTAVRLVAEASATHRLSLLRKRGYTTMEAVRGIAELLGIPEASVGYCGLKDEDGVTEQLISVPVTVPMSANEQINVNESDRWYVLQHYGFSGAPLRIGQMEGNSFKIILRNLESRHLDGFFARKKINFLFLNYFDTQRFGVPGGPHRTHLVGAAMLDGLWDDARRTLIELRSPESSVAAAWAGSSRELFLHLDSRVSSFFTAAYASFEWNTELAKLLTSTASAQIRHITIDGIEFAYLDGPSDVARVMAVAHELPMKKYAFGADGPVPSAASVRSTVAQAVLEVDGRQDDEYFPGRKRVELSFFLPSGSYATSAVRQLLMQVT